MLEEHRLLRRTILSVFALVIAALSDCDESDDGDDFDDDHHLFLGGGGAQVAVLMTDHPLDGVRKLHVTIREVALLGGASGPVTLYGHREEGYRGHRGHRAGRRVDLLSLRGEDSTRLFDVVPGRDEIAAGIYRAMRIVIADPLLVLDDGEPFDAESIDFVGDGVIEVDFREPLPLGPDDPAYLVLDFEVERSLIRRDDAGPTAWTFRPLVLLDVERDEGDGRPGDVPYLTPRQSRKMTGLPDMLTQFAHHLAEGFRAAGYPDVEVRARVKTALNGRSPQLLIDPDVDLAAEPGNLGHAEWILPLKGEL